MYVNFVGTVNQQFNKNQLRTDNEREVLTVENKSFHQDWQSEHKEDVNEQIGNNDNVEGLIQDLENRNMDIRREAARSLGNIKDVRAVDSLIEALKDSETSVRMCAALSLGQIGDKRAQKPLIAALNNDNHYVRSYAISGLIELMGGTSIDILIEALYRELKRVEEADAAGFGLKGTGLKIQFWEDVVEELLNPYNTAEYVLVEIIKELGKLADSRAVPHLINVFKNKVAWYDPGIWTYILEAFGKIGDERAFQYVALVLTNKDEAYRKLAARVLGEIGGRDAVNALTQALMSEKSPDVKETIKSALEKVDKFKRNE